LLVAAIEGPAFLTRRIQQSSLSQKGPVLRKLL
jgi:hypothetical protein